MKTYGTIKVGDKFHVVTQTSKDRKDTDLYPDANYRNTGLALCGILKDNETLQDWINRKIKRGLKQKES